MANKITVALAGLGSRGKDTYAKAAKIHPDKIEIVAIADVNPKKVEMVAEEYHIPKERCYTSAEEMLKEEKLADVMFITTQDRQHVAQAIPALKKGYHLLLEKPISPDLDECREIVKVAKECDRKVVVCHVLRYTPVFRKVKEILDSGVIGDIVSINASENVGWFHMAHSFVRGNWRNKELSSPMILQKCCHDMDLYLWLADKKCKSLSSFGSTYLFKEENAPEGCTKRCLDGCKVKATCPYDAESIYLDSERIGARNGNTRWPLDVVTEIPTPESVEEALKTGPYGRCVYHCDNDVVDHEVVDMEFENGATAVFTMTAFTKNTRRTIRVMGTLGELEGDSVKGTIEVKPFNSDEVETIDVSKQLVGHVGHAGGDTRLVDNIIDILRKDDLEHNLTSIDASVHSHVMALAAEESRVNHGKSISIREFESKF